MCDGRLKASLLVETLSRKHAVEILEDEKMTYALPDGQVRLRQRGRIAWNLAREKGFDGYSCVSFLDLEYATDERQLLDNLVDEILGRQEVPKVSSRGAVRDDRKRAQVLD